MSTKNKRPLSSITRGVSPPGTPPAKRKAQSAITKAAAANFFKPTSQKEPEPVTWKIAGNTLLIAKYARPSNVCKDEQPPKEPPRTKIAGFDLDSTLIVTQSRKKFAKDGNDWKWWNDSVPGKLRELYEDGFQITVFTNQAAIKDPKKVSSHLKIFKTKITALLNALDIPMHVFAAAANDKYRKPRTGMWEEMKDELDLDVHGVQLDKSFLVGDAAGREGDFADSDRHWTMNVGIGFQTPEEFFLGEPAKPMLHRFDPSIYLHAETAASAASDTSPTLFTATEDQELVVLVGSPGAGKSTFYERHLKPFGYERVNQDVLKSRDKCVKAARDFLGHGKSVAIDNTNPEVATRAVWVSLAREHKVPVRCVYLNTPAQLCIHNDVARALGGELLNPEKRSLLPKVAFNTFASKFQEPAAAEGFNEVTKIDFKWTGGNAEREIWSKYWI